jgi:predicted dinucleotide-utilizing enzyme
LSSTAWRTGASCGSVLAEGRFDRLRIEIENVPSENPRTGEPSYLSTIAYLGTWARRSSFNT